MPTVSKLMEALEELQRGGHAETHVYFVDEGTEILYAINSMSIEDNGDGPIVCLWPEQHLEKLEDESYEVRKYYGNKND